MDIKRPPASENSTNRAQSITQALNLKLNQLLEVKVISSEAKTQTLALEISSSNKAIHVQSKQTFKPEAGQTLNLQVTKLTPSPEFKVLDSQTLKQADNTAIILKTTNYPVKLAQRPETEKTGVDLATKLLTAKIISINKDDIQLKLINATNPETTTYNKQQPLNPTINLTKQQLALLIKTENGAVSNQPLSYKPGQTLQLALDKLAPNPASNSADTNQLNLSKGQLISATVIGLDNNKIQLGLLKSQSSAGEISDKTRLSITEKQLSYTTAKNTPSTLLVNQKVILEVTKATGPLEFKILDSQQTQISAEKQVLATVIAVKNNQVQLQLPSSSTSPLFITLNKQQLINSLPPKAQNSALQLSHLKPGKQIPLQTNQLLQNSQMDNKIADTIKHYFPIQGPPNELLNQLISTTPLIQDNEKVSDALKRLAREILETIPQLKDLEDHKQLKKLISQSGLFLEAKLTQSNHQKDPALQADFKNLLLKFQLILKQELAIAKEKKAESLELNLLKEIQQKTESSLAKLILNQLTTLPKEESSRQVWVLDLPFLNKENAENVRVEIDREQQSEQDDENLNWTVNITISPPELAPIHCKVSCIEQTINTLFWSDNDAVLEKIQHNLDYLKGQFEKSGLTPGHMSAKKGLPAATEKQQINGQTLFDQKV